MLMGQEDGQTSLLSDDAATGQVFDVTVFDTYVHASKLSDLH